MEQRVGGIALPGAMAPPRYSPLARTASNTVAVPKSTTIAGPPYRVSAAAASTIRSAPTSRGLSYSTFIPVLNPGSHHQRLDPEVGVAHLDEHTGQGRNAAAHGHGVDLAGRYPLRSKQAADEQAVLVGEAGAVRRYAPRRARRVVGGTAGLVEYAQGDVRVADVDVQAAWPCPAMVPRHYTMPPPLHSKLATNNCKLPTTHKGGLQWLHSGRSETSTSICDETWYCGPGPSVVVYPDDEIVVAFLRSRTAGHGHPAVEACIVRSTDGGDTWSEPWYSTPGPSATRT